MLQLIREQFITRLDHIYRFNGTPIIPPAESVAQHSYWVTMYSNLIFRDLFLLACKQNESMPTYFEMYNFTIRQSLFHDTGEQVTGDVLWSVKYHPEEGESVRKSLDKIVGKEISKNQNDNIFTLEWASVAWKDQLLGPKHTVDNSVTDISEDRKEVCMKIKKVADWISTYHFCYNQYCLGNKLMVEKAEIAVTEMRKVIVELATVLEESGLPYSCSALESIIN